MSLTSLELKEYAASVGAMGCGVACIDRFEDAPEGNDLVKLDNYSIDQQPLKHVISDQEIDPNETR